MAKTTIEISGVWLRSEGPVAIVSVEVDGQWVDLVRGTPTEEAISHIVEPEGIRRAASSSKEAR